MARVQVPLRHSAYYRAMLVGEWGLLILDLIGAAALGAALIIAIWRRSARRPHDYLHGAWPRLKGEWLREKGLGGIKPRRPQLSQHSQQP